MKTTTLTLAALGLLSAVSFGINAAQPVSADQTQNLQPMGSISVSQIGGSPSDLRSKLAKKAQQEGATSFRVTELTQGDHWHATAELYK